MMSPDTTHLSMCELWFRLQIDSEASQRGEQPSENPNLRNLKQHKPQTKFQPRHGNPKRGCAAAKTNTSKRLPGKSHSMQQVTYGGKWGKHVPCTCSNQACALTSQEFDCNPNFPANMINMQNIALPPPTRYISPCILVIFKGTWSHLWLVTATHHKTPTRKSTAKSQRWVELLQSNQKLNGSNNCHSDNSININGSSY